MQMKSSVRSARTRGKVTLGLRERKRLTQLLLSVVLFLVVLLGKGTVSTGIFQGGQELLQLIRSDTDFAGVFSTLGTAVAEGEPVLATLGKISVQIFGGEPVEEETEKIREIGSGAQAAAAALTRRPTAETMLLSLGVTMPAQELEQVEQSEPTPQPEPTPEIPAYTGPALPAGATMEYCDLALENTVTPVLGELSSAYGYRDHPLDGEYSFHKGVDLAADKGTPIAAFASGTVDYIGESDAYGLYIQLNHGNGITTFYCHCSELFARKGETVKIGQTIAAVGNTGNATGSHLHFELKSDGVLLNPMYYIETL